MVRKCSEPTLFAACSADDDDGNGDNNGVSGGEGSCGLDKNR